MERGWRCALGVLGALVAVAGCRSEPEWLPTADPITLPSTSTTSTTEPPATTTTTTTVPTIVFPGARLTSCVNAVQFGAFSGDDELAQVWQSRGADPERVRDYCRDLADDDPEGFVALGEGWLAVEKLTTTTVSTERADEVLVVACVERVEWGVFGEDPQYERIWADVGEDGVVLADVCTRLVLADPVLANELLVEVDQIEAFFEGGTATTAAP